MKSDVIYVSVRAVRVRAAPSWDAGGNHTALRRLQRPREPFQVSAPECIAVDILSSSDQGEKGRRRGIKAVRRFGF